MNEIKNEVTIYSFDTAKLSQNYEINIDIKFIQKS